MARNGHLRSNQSPGTIFVSGSRSIKSLSDSARDNLDQYVNSGSHILVGDAPGVDTLVQQYLAHLHYANVTVCHIGDVPRNNFGFATHHVTGQRQTDKDIFMAQAADRGLAIWDGKSPGTKQNISRLPTDVINPPAPVSVRGEQARADVLAQSASENVRELYNVPEGATRGQHTTALHHANQFVRDDFERGATVSDSVLSIPRDPDSRSPDSSVVKIGTESHAITFVSGFITDSDVARAKGERLHQLAEKACGQWTDTNGRWQIFTSIYDSIRKDENGQYRNNDEKAQIIDQVLDSLAGWAEHLPEPVQEPTAQEIHQYTLELAAENQHAVAENQDDPDLAKFTDAQLLYLRELNSHSRGLATIGELTNFTLEDAEPELVVDETQVYGDVFESAILDAADLVTAEQLGAEITGTGGPALDATFDRISLDTLPPTIPDTLSEQTQTLLFESLLPNIDAQIDRGVNKHEILSALYKDNRANEAERFNQSIERAFGKNQETARPSVSRQDQLNALTSLRLLLAGEYKRETRGFSREAIAWAKDNYRLNADDMRKAGQLKVGQYQQLVNEQTAARSQWQQQHEGQQVPYRAQIARISELENAGYKVNHRISALNPSTEELRDALHHAQGNLVSARSHTQSRLDTFAQAETRLAELQVEAKQYAQSVREDDQFATAKSLFVHNENERAIDQRQEAVRANNPRFDYLSGSLASNSSDLAQLRTEHREQSQAERSQLVGLLINPRIESEQFAVAAEIKDHQIYFTQIAGQEILTSAEAQNALHPSLSNLDSVISFADNSIQRLDPTNQTPVSELGLSQAPVYVSLVSNEQLRIPVSTLPEYDAISKAINDCRLETATWRSLHSPAPITGRDEERDAVAMFVGDYIDFRQHDRVTAELNHNQVFRDYAQRLSDTRTTEELIATTTAVSKENFANHQQQQAHLANPETVLAPKTPPLSLKEMRQLFLYATPAGATKAATAEMRSVLLSNVFGREKADRTKLLANGQLQPSPTLTRLLQNLEARTTLSAVNHFYASLRNPEPARANTFNLYEAHQSLPQFEKDFLYQHALANKYESLKEPQARTADQTQHPLITQPNEPSIAQIAKETDSYRSYYGNADFREATNCAAALAQQEGLSRADLDRHTITSEFSDLEVRTINYAVHNFEQGRQSQVVQHLRDSDDRHTQALGDMLALASEATRSGAADREITIADLNLPANYQVTSEDTQKTISFAVQPSSHSLHPDDLAAARELAQHEAWSGLQESLISDPALFVDAPATALAAASEFHQLVHSAAELQDRARTAIAVRNEHLNSCVDKAARAIQASPQTSGNGHRSIAAATTRELVNLALNPGQKDRNGVLKGNEREFQIVRGALAQSDIQRAAELSQYATTARNDYLHTFAQLDTGRSALQVTQSQLAENVNARYEAASKGVTSASTRFATVRDAVERTLLGEQLGQVLVNDLNTQAASARELLPPEVVTQTAATARDEAWQSFEPQEIRDSRAGVVVDERTLNAAYQLMDSVDAARTLETSSAETHQLEAAFQQIDEALEQLDVTRAEVRMEQQLAQYQQIAQPVAQRVNDYLKDTTREEGLKAILEPLRHEEHVERIALTILQTAQDNQLQLDHSPDSLAQVQQVAGTLFTSLRDGMERANSHLVQGMELTAELHRMDPAASHQHQHDALATLNGHSHISTFQDLGKASHSPSAPDQLLDLTKGGSSTELPSMELDDLTRTDIAQSQLNNSGTQNNALAQTPAAHEENSQALDLVLM